MKVVCVFLAILGTLLASLRSHAVPVCYEETFENTCWDSSEPPPEDEDCAGVCDPEMICSPERKFDWFSENTDKVWTETEAVSDGGRLAVNATPIICWARWDCKCENDMPGDTCVPEGIASRSDVNIDRELAEEPGLCEEEEP